MSGGVGYLGSGDAWLIVVMPMVPLYLAYSGKLAPEQKNNLILLCAQQYIVAGALSVVWIPHFHTVLAMPPSAVVNFFLVTFLATFLPYFFIQWAEKKNISCNGNVYLRPRAALWWNVCVDGRRRACDDVEDIRRISCCTCAHHLAAALACDIAPR